MRGTARAASAALLGVALLPAACGGNVVGFSPADGGHESGTEQEADAGPGPSECSRPAVDCSSSPVVRPVLAYSLDGVLANQGSAVGHDAVAKGPVSFVPGISGKAASLPSGSTLTFPGTAAVLSSAAALTFSVWVRVPGPPATLRTYLGCRSSEKGFETYTGVDGTTITTCAGYGGWPPPWGACATVYPACTLAQYTHFVLRWGGTGKTPETAADGGPWTELTNSYAGSSGYPMPADFNLFQGATDLASGIPVEPTAAFEIDDVRVYDVALADDVVWKITGCPAP